METELLCLYRARELAAPLPPAVIHRMEWEAGRAIGLPVSPPPGALRPVRRWRAWIQLAPWARS